MTTCPGVMPRDVVSHEELVMAMEELHASKRPSAAAFKELLDDIDMDKDGRIDEHDFAMSMKAADDSSPESPHEVDGFGRRLKKGKTNAEKAAAYQNLHAFADADDELPADRMHRMRTGGVKAGSGGSLSYIIKNFDYGQW